MDNGQIVGAIVMAICSFGCCALFYGIGCCAEKARNPFGFWAGSTVLAEKVTDLRAYNHANAVMWKIYSVPYLISGIVSLFGFLGDVFTLYGAVIMTLSCFPGIFFLIAHYRKIEKKYIIK